MKALWPLSRFLRKRTASRDGLPLLTGAMRRQLAAHDEALTERSRSLVRRLAERAVDERDLAGAAVLFDDLVHVGHIRRVIEQLAQSFREPENGATTFAMGTQVLYEAFGHLAPVKTEAIVHAAGSRFGTVATVERLLPLKLDASEYAYARANDDHVIKVLAAIDAYGSQLTAYFHSHPGSGPEANHPSSVDLANQERLERGGFHTVGGIFSRDGYLRFFTRKLAFHITITGKGIDHVGQNLYQLTGT
jgi:proteasome lid subunit RPN8/RPN11